MNSKIWLSPPHMSGFENEFVDLAFKTNWIAPLGDNINGFEKDIETYLENNCFSAALNSGTAAIHLALRLLNIRKGDIVLCQSKTFIASVNPVLMEGATPVFIDSEIETWNLSPELLEKAIIDYTEKGNKPKVIIAVHLYGMPYQKNKIHDLAIKYNIPIIEDAAEAFGSSVNNEKCGTFGDLSALSFNGNKILTTSAGGALICKGKYLKEKAIYLATQAKDIDGGFSHSEIGYNYRMSNVLAGIGRGQMKVLDKYVDLRKRNFEYYFEHLTYLPSISFLIEPEGYFSNRWLTVILLESTKERNEICELLKNNNIETRYSWKPMHLQPIFKECISYINGVSEDIHNRGLCLPSGSNLTLSDLERITSLIKSYFS